ncbi:hypothetical protein Tco_1545389, partial [Tanacetum coccineum]
MVIRAKIIPPTMMTQSAGRPAAASRGGGTGGRAGSGGGKTRGCSEVKDAVNDIIRGDVSRGCTYKEFLDCNPKEYDGKGKVKYTTGSFVGKALTWWNSQIYTRGQESTI